MAKKKAKNKSRSVKDAVCASCLGSFKFKELTKVNIEMHRGYPENGYYSVWICDKCEPKFELERRAPKTSQDAT